MLWWAQPESIVLLDPYQAIDCDYLAYQGNWQSKTQGDAAALQKLSDTSVQDLEGHGGAHQQEDYSNAIETEDVCTGTVEQHEQVTQHQQGPDKSEQHPKRKRKRKATVSQEQLDARHPGNERNRAAQHITMQAWQIFCEWANAQPPICCHIHGALHASGSSASTATTTTLNPKVPANQPQSHESQQVHGSDQEVTNITSISQAEHQNSWRYALVRKAQVPITNNDDASMHSNNTAHEMTDWVSLHAMRHVVHPKIQFTAVEDVESNADEQVMNLYGSLVTNHRQQEVIAMANDVPVLLPTHSSFLMTDLAIKGSLHPLMEGKQRFKVIVADPPWENASVRRSGRQENMTQEAGITTALPCVVHLCRYPTLPDRVLLQLPIKQLLDQQGLLLLWMTNREKLHRFVHTELLPALGLRHVATWYWLKLAEGGMSPVSCLQTMHRHPFEHLLVCAPVGAAVQPRPLHESRHSNCSHSMHGYTIGGSNGTTTNQQGNLPHVPVAQPEHLPADANDASHNAATEPCCTDASDANQQQQTNTPTSRHSTPVGTDDNGHVGVLRVPASLVMLSVPAADHSRKPFLGPLLDHLLPGLIPDQGTHPACLELFAREMHSNWASVGNEVLRFQHLALFKSMTQ